MPFCFVDLILLWGSSAVFSQTITKCAPFCIRRSRTASRKKERARKTNKAIKKQEQDGKPKPENKEPQTVQLTC
jgi:hypothetical protein